MQINVAPQAFEVRTYIHLESDTDIEGIQEDTELFDKNGLTWFLIDLEIQNKIPFQLKCPNYEGPVWVTENRKVILPLKGHEITNEFDEEGFDTIENYLFIPNMDKIRDISDFDKDTGFIPRIDIFGDYNGDGFVQPRQKIKRGVFRGFYEDLTANSQITIINEYPIISFENNQDTTSQLSKVANPIHVMCFNADVLNDGQIKVSFQEPWITPTINLVKYSISEKFIIQCFELIRLTSLQFELAEQMKILSFYISVKIRLDEENYELIAVALYYFVTNIEQQDPSNIHEINDNIIYPVYYSFRKNDILELQPKLLEIYQNDEIQKYKLFLLDISKLLSDRDTSLQNELDNSMDSSVAEELLSLHMSFVNSIENQFFKIYILGEIIARLHLVFPTKVIDIYDSYLRGLTTTNLVPLLSDLRSMFQIGSVHKYKDFIWGPSLIYTILAYCKSTQHQYWDGVTFLHKAHNFMQTKRDFIQLLFSYSSILKSIHKYNYNHKIMILAYDYLFKGFNWLQKVQIIDLNESALLFDFIIPSKQILRLDISDEFTQMMKYFANVARTKMEELPTLPTETVEIGLGLLADYVNEVGYENVLLLLQTCSVDIFYTLYRTELYDENPELAKIIKISEFMLNMTEDREFYSYIFPVKFNFTRERHIHYINLLVFYSVIGETKKYDELRIQFENEFAEKLDYDVFREIKDAISSQSKLESYLLTSASKNNSIDQSIIYYLKIKNIIQNYFENKSLTTLVDRLLELSQQAKSFENYRPHFECLKLIFRCMLSIKADFRQNNAVREDILRYIDEYGLLDSELELKPITDETLKKYTDVLICPIFLTPIR